MFPLVRARGGGGGDGGGSFKRNYRYRWFPVLFFRGCVISDRQTRTERVWLLPVRDFSLIRPEQAGTERLWVPLLDGFVGRGGSWDRGVG